MIGERLTVLRRKHNMTQNDLAEKLSISQHSVSKYERDEVEPNDQTKIAIATLFDVSVDYLLGLSDCRAEKPADLSPEETALPVLLFSGNQTLCDSLEAFHSLFRQNQIHLTVLPDLDGPALYHTICLQKPAAVILNAFMRNMDGLDLMQKCRNTGGISETQFFLYSGIENEYITSEAARLGCSYFFLLPFDPASLVGRVVSILSRGKGRKVSEMSPSSPPAETMVDHLLNQIGIPTHIKGYQYLKEAVLLTLENETVLMSIMKTLYPSIARTYGATVPSVERAIRHAVECGWQQSGFSDTGSGLTGASLSRKPTNSEAIAQIADRIRARMSDGKVRRSETD